MTATQDYFSQLLESAARSNHRFGVVLRGSDEWQQSSLESLCSLVASDDVFLLGCQTALKAAKSVSYKKGQQLLGQECQLLICDFRTGFDANSFSAATGCVMGGGLVVILPQQQDLPGFEQRWLASALNKLNVIQQNKPLPQICHSTELAIEPFEQQKLAIEKIIKVVEGHRKRPLVMTADRGRGKSSALGIAAAQLMQSRQINIVVTAPSLTAVQPIFDHAQRLLPHAELSKGQLVYQASSLKFVAPDELIRSQLNSDCLFVDEASAIPIPMLKQMVERHHRAVFSTTIHGYEGCGRGFTLKFQSWLKQQRPGGQTYHLEQPIRWSANDPLEQWLFDTFLLNAEMEQVVEQESVPKIRTIDKQTLVAQPHLLRACFALLVNAHYQTSPNDLMLLLADEAIQLHALMQGPHCLGCMLTVEEGKLESELIEQIQLGKRRPKGHMVATLIASQLGFAEAAKMSSLRVMRIAVHPQLQRTGIGRQMVNQLIENSHYDFYSTSFGATAELVSFWQQCGFTALKLGSVREQASGTHSLVMMRGEVEWQYLAEQHFELALQYSLSETFKQLEIELVRSLSINHNASVVKPSVPRLVEHYCHGGASYDSIAPLLECIWRQAPSSWSNASDLLVRKVVQRWSWDECRHAFNYAGHKQVEQAFRGELADWIGVTKS